MELNRRLIFTSIVASICSFQPGIFILLSLRPLDGSMGWTVYMLAAYGIGGLLGAILIPFVANKLGRKIGLLCSNGLVWLGLLFQLVFKFTAYNPLLLLGGFCFGLNFGLNSGLIPIYLIEISTTRWRGAFGTVYQLVQVIFLLLADVIFGGISYPGAREWFFLLPIIPAAFQLATLPFCPESPKHLFINKREMEEAKKGLAWLRETSASGVELELEEYQAEYEKINANQKVTLMEMFRNYRLRTPLILACTIMLAQQFCGLNLVSYSTTGVLQYAGLDRSGVNATLLAFRFMFVVITFVSLLLVDRIGRKPLLLVGLAVMLVTLAIFFVRFTFWYRGEWLSYLCVLAVLGFQWGFALGLGSIPQFLPCELFNQAGRPLATSVTVVLGWIANLLVGFFFLPLLHRLDNYIYLVPAFLLIWFTIFIHVKLPETKNKSALELRELF